MRAFLKASRGGTIGSRLDVSALGLLRSRRVVREHNAPARLSLLRRLRERALLHELVETRVEQSWNEQLFSRVLGYRTLLSHDALPFHVLPKNHAGTRRYDDFSLGFFGLGDDIVVGTAELKSPGADLDTPQTSGNYNGQTPVEQALAAGRAHGGRCRWVIVSNFCEIRLYDLHDRSTGLPPPVAVVADLRLIRNPHDLAVLRAHLDVAALLGEPGKENAEMLAALDVNDPSQPLPAREGHSRLVIRFTPRGDRILPLYVIEKGAREAAVALGEHLPAFRERRRVSFRVKGAWVAADEMTSAGPAARLAASRFGEVQLSTCVSLSSISGVSPGGQSGLGGEVSLDSLLDVAHGFMSAAEAFERSTHAGSKAGAVSAELRETCGVVLAPQRLLEAESGVSGVCPETDISVGDFEVVDDELDLATARCLCELAIQFRGDLGGVALSEHLVKAHLRSRSQR